MLWFYYNRLDLKPEDRLTWLLDITIAYADSIPLDLPTIIMGYRKRCYTYLCYRIYPISQVTCDFNLEYIYICELLFNRNCIVNYVQQHINFVQLIIIIFLFGKRRTIFLTSCNNIEILRNRLCITINIVYFKIINEK